MEGTCTRFKWRIENKPKISADKEAGNKNLILTDPSGGDLISFHVTDGPAFWMNLLNKLSKFLKSVFTACKQFNFI